MNTGNDSPQRHGDPTQAPSSWWIAMLGLFGASLFFGDGVITPAMSVLSAVEGVEVAAPGLRHLVVPVTAVISIRPRPMPIC